MEGGPRVDRRAQRSRSAKEFASRLGTVIEEADETMYWMEIAVETELLTREDAAPVWRELNEVVKLLVASVTTTRDRIHRT